MSIFEKHKDESALMISQKLIVAWVVAADNKINTLDHEYYDSFFPSGIDLKKVIEHMDLYNNDIKISCEHLSEHYKNNPKDAVLFIKLLISFAFTNKTVYAYEKIILDYIKKIIHVESILFSKEFEDITNTSFFPIGNVSSKSWWENPDAFCSDDFIDFYSLLNLEYNCSSSDIRLQLGNKNINISQQNLDDIEHILLNSTRKGVYKKYLIYSKIISNLYNSSNSNSSDIDKKIPFEFKTKEYIKIKTNYVIAFCVITALCSIANFKYDFIRIGAPEPIDKSITLVNIAQATAPTKEVVIPNKNFKTINSDQLHLRDGPGIEHNILNILEKGELVEVKNEINGWSNIIYKDESVGWMATIHLATAN